MIENNKAVILHIISGLGDGGAEGVLYRLIKSDTKNVHQVIALTGGGKYESLLIKIGVSVSSLNLPRGSFTFKSAIQLYKKIKQSKATVVQTWMYHSDLIGGVIAKFAHVELIIWNIRHSNLNPEDTKKSTIVVAKLCALFSYFIPNRIVCCAEEAKEVHISIGYQAKKITVIGNGYDLARYKPIKQLNVLKKKHNIDNSTPILGMVGRFTPEKDHENLLAAISLLKSKFLLVLAGPQMDKDNKVLVKLIERYSLLDRVIFLGQVNDVPSLMNELDLHILSSSSEGFPNVIAEAMACEVPCVTTCAGSAGVIVGDTGWVVPTKDSKALSDSITDALDEIKSNEYEWKCRKSKSRQRIVQNFSLEVMIDKYNEVWTN